MDWSKVGQAFQGGANVLASGLMDKHQRKLDQAEWEKKTDYSADIAKRQRQALQDLQTNEINHRAFLDMKKKEFETDPELFPIWQAAQGGDEKAREILEASTEFRHYVDSGIPLTSAQVTRLIDQGTPIPPGIRSRILAGHMKASYAEDERKAEDEGRKARTRRDTATAKKAEMDLAEGSAVGRAEVNKARADTTKLITDRVADREKRQAAIQQLDTNILTLQQLSDEKIKEEELTKGDVAKAAVRMSRDNLELKIKQAEKQKKGLEADIQREADLLKKKRPDLFPEESEETPPRRGTVIGEIATSPTGQVYVWSGYKWDKK